MPPRTRTQQFSCSTLSLLMCTLFCAFNTCVSCITFFLGLAASHSSKDPPSPVAKRHHILRRTLLPWPIDYLHPPNWTVCAGVVGVALSAKKSIRNILDLQYNWWRSCLSEKVIEINNSFVSPLCWKRPRRGREFRSLVVYTQTRCLR